MTEIVSNLFIASVKTKDSVKADVIIDLYSQKTGIITEGKQTIHQFDLRDDEDVSIYKLFCKTNRIIYNARLKGGRALFCRSIS